MSDNEVVVDMIGGLRRPVSLVKADSCVMVVTNRRMIIAQLTSQAMTDMAMQARERAKSEGKGFFGQWAEQLKGTFSYAEKYRSMEPSAIMAETSGNFALENNDIAQIKINYKPMRSGGQYQPGEFEIIVDSTTGKFNFKTHENDDCIRILKQSYGDRVKPPFGYFSSHGVNVRLGI